MRALQSHEIRGNWATLLLPWGEDDALDHGRLAAEIDILCSFKPDGIYSTGTSGEFHAIDEEEFATVCALLAGRCEAAGIPFQIGACHMSAQISLKRVAVAAAFKPGAIQVILPDWLPVGVAEARRFLDKVARAADGIGLVLYNPPHAKRVFSPEEIGELADAVDALVGVKVAGGDAAWHDAFRRHAGRLSLFAPGHLLASRHRLGARGSYSNMACLHPAAAQQWWRQIEAGDPAALELESRIVRFMDECIRPFIVNHGMSGAACDRFMALVGGWADTGPRMRWPCHSIPATEADRIRPAARRTIPEFFPQNPT